MANPMSSAQRKRVTTQTVTPASGVDEDLFGPPPLLPGEDADRYASLLTQFTAAIAPRDCVEAMLVRDVVTLALDLERLRRWRNAYLVCYAHEGLEQVLRPRLGAEQ